MDFEQVLKALLTEFDRRQIRYAVIGGFALGALGVIRATLDVDFLVHQDDLPTLHALLTGFGYRLDVQTENVSHYSHPDPRWGVVDFLHAFRKASLAMLERATPRPILNGTLSIKVAEPEDVIGLKIQAMANNPKRRAKDLQDIEQLMERFRGRLDWERVQEFFDLFELGEEGKRLKEQFGHVE